MFLSSFSSRAQNGQSASEKIASLPRAVALDLLDREVERQVVESDARELAHPRVGHVLLGGSVVQVADDDVRDLGIGVDDLLVEHHLVESAYGLLATLLTFAPSNFCSRSFLIWAASTRERCGACAAAACAGMSADPAKSAPRRGRARPPARRQERDDGRGHRGLRRGSDASVARNARGIARRGAARRRRSCRGCGRCGRRRVGARRAARARR